MKKELEKKKKTPLNFRKTSKETNKQNHKNTKQTNTLGLEPVNNVPKQIDLLKKMAFPNN